MLFTQQNKNITTSTELNMGLNISNNQYKKERAKEHNAARVEAQAYEEDRVRQPEKYEEVVNLASRRKAINWAVIAMGMGL